MEESTSWKGRKRNGGAIRRGRRRLRTDQSKGRRRRLPPFFLPPTPFFPFSLTKSSLTFPSRRNESRSKKKSCGTRKSPPRLIIEPSSRDRVRGEKGGAAGLRERIPSRSIHAEHGIPHLPKKMTQGKKRGWEEKEKEAV